MLSYQHSFHAGCFADVVKHLTLTRLVNYLMKKDKPLLYLETHAGRGLYDLQDAAAQKTKEYQQGILPLWENKKTLSALFFPYLAHLNALNPQSLRYYPGSPYLARQLLRKIDRLVFYERHAKEFSYLQENIAPGRRIFLHYEDGLPALEALLPPIEKRGLIFIDPSYEIKEEYKTIPASVARAYKRFAMGVYCIWYPIIDPYTHAQFLRRLENITTKDVLKIEFIVDKNNIGMKGCGLWIINPPYLLAEEMRSILSTLSKILNPGKSTYVVD